MAARTPSTWVRESMGSLTAHIATFSDMDTGDNWASGIQGIIAVIPTTINGALTIANLVCCFTATDGTIWFFCEKDNQVPKILVLAKS